MFNVVYYDIELKYLIDSEYFSFMMDVEEWNYFSRFLKMIILFLCKIFIEMKFDVWIKSI